MSDTKADKALDEIETRLTDLLDRQWNVGYHDGIRAAQKAIDAAIESFGDDLGRIPALLFEALRDGLGNGLDKIKAAEETTDGND